MRKGKFLTDDGLRSLGQIIRSSRVNQGMTLRNAAKKITDTTGESVTFTALGKIERGAVMPEFNTLVAIAEAEFVTDQNGKPLTIYDFIDIACEVSASYKDKNRDNGMKFAKMIELAMQANKVAQEELEAEAQKMIDAQATFTSLDRLREIQLGLGNPPEQSERRVFYVIIDPRRLVYTYEQWLGIEEPAIRELRDKGNSHVNQS